MVNLYGGIIYTLRTSLYSIALEGMISVDEIKYFTCSISKSLSTFVPNNYYKIVRTKVQITNKICVEQWRGIDLQIKCYRLC